MKPKIPLLFSVIILLMTIVVVFLLPRKTFDNKTYSFNKGQTTNSPSPATTTLFFAGDIMLSRNVDAKMVAASDFNLPFENLTSEISKNDIAFANLESPFNNSGSHFVDGSLTFNADPAAVSGLKFAGFDVLSTANNHTLDQGANGLDLTYNLLKQNGIEPIGTTKACHSGVILTRNNINFGYLAYSYTALNDGGKSTSPDVCDANDLKQLKTDVTNIRPKVDVLVVSMHAGIEYTRTPNNLQMDFAKAAADAGADFVVGAHPHWIQKPIENIGKGKRTTWVFYSLGNFVFDQMWSQDTREGMTIEITYSGKQLQKIELKPVIIDNFCCPRWTTDTETKSILQKHVQSISHSRISNQSQNHFPIPRR
jgi:poly-gamma-glutamate capsule biosynthesis protein CapA/YwtB (metallophosphatase superfamily)